MKTGIIAAVVLAAVALYFVFGTDMLAPATSDVVATSQDLSSEESVRASKKFTHGREFPETAEGSPGTRATPSGDDAVGDAQAEAVPGSAPGVTRTLGTPTQYTRHDGVVIRDHRVNAPKPDLDAYTVLPPEASKVKPNILIEVRQALRGPMMKCINTHSESPAEDAELQLLLLTSIASENLTVDKASLKISGLANEDDLRTCVEEAVVGHQQAADGAEDVNIHRMVFKYDL